VQDAPPAARRGAVHEVRREEAQDLRALLVRRRGHRGAGGLERVGVLVGAVVPRADPALLRIAHARELGEDAVGSAGVEPSRAREDRDARGLDRAPVGRDARHAPGRRPHRGVAEATGRGELRQIEVAGVLGQRRVPQRGPVRPVDGLDATGLLAHDVARDAERVGERAIGARDAVEHAQDRGVRAEARLDVEPARMDEVLVRIEVVVQRRDRLERGPPERGETSP
jgi:hypothetical protein